MRRILTIFSIGCLFACFLACKNKPEDQQPPKRPHDGHVFNGNDSFSAKSTPVGYADACREQYDKLYSPNGPNDAAIEAAYTESVGFYGPELLKYLQGVDSLDKRVIRMVLGVYVDPDQYNLTAAADQKVNPDDYKKRVGRLTVFVWPSSIDKAGNGNGHGNGHGHGHGHGHGPYGDDCENCSPLNYGVLQP